MKKLLALLFVLAVAAGALWKLTRADPVGVRVHEVERGRVEATVANTRVGTVEACRRARMSPAASGQVALLYIKEGDPVQAGDILLEIWNDDLQANLMLAEVEVDAAKAQADEACAMAAGARREADRVTRLRADGVVSEDEADRAATEAISRQAACAAATATTRVVKSRIEVARHELERTVLRASFGGVVAEVNAKLGEYLTPSPPGIATKPAIDLIDPTCLFVSAPIDEVDAPRITTGMPVCVTLDAFPEKHCEARVRRIAPYVQDAEKQARTVEVEVSLPRIKASEKLLPGYSADIEVLIDARDDVVRVPSEAVLEGARVLVFDRETGILEERKFTPGLSNWAFTEARSGLTEGEWVVVSIGRAGVEAGVTAVVESE